MMEVDTDARFMEYQASKLKPEEMTASELLVASTKAMPEAYAEGVPKMISGGTKGLVSGIAGTPGELVGLASGILNAIMPMDYTGQEHDPQKSRLDRFIEGYEAVPIKTSDIREGLTKAGWKVDEIGEPLETVMEFVGPGALTKKTITKGIEVVGKKLGNGLDSAKKSFNLPDKVYHGTDKKFSTFKNTEGGIYFTDNPEIAKRFGKNMKEVEIKLENPYVIDDFSFDSGMGEKFELWKNKIKKMLGSRDYGRTLKSNAWSVEPDTIKRLQDKGYDGIAIPSSVSSSGDNRYIVFDSSQIINKGKK